MAMITATTSCSRSVDCAWCPLDALCACSGRWALKGWSAAFPGGRTSSRVCRYTQVQAMVAAPGEDVRMTENAHERVPAALQRLAASVAAPEALTVPGLRQRFGDSQGVEVAVGQLWRACPSGSAAGAGPTPGRCCGRDCGLVSAHPGRSSSGRAWWRSDWGSDLLTARTGS